ncbi:GlxA family transcriptional regulator [Paracoccus sp. (in: a-proteobacteria)]|uniref:GlxA family transcriptional regulator n=1 Tax=Paracoccus sp. TaxID=267 RepID=UPI0032209141
MMALAALIEPLRVANRFGGALYEWVFLSADGHPARASNGLPFAADAAIRDAGQVETVVVVASFDPLKSVTPELLGWLRQQARAGAVLGALDTGAWVLAEAGLLQGKQCTMHWEAVPSFLETFDGIEISLNLFELSPRLFTCAGGTAALDMMLALIADEHGTDLAVRVAEQFIHNSLRVRSDSQRLSLVERLGISSPKLVQAIQAMENNLEDPYDVEDLAGGVGVTRRQLERLFRAHLNDTPSNFYMKLRLAHARRLLQQTEMSITQISVACGFTAAAHFSRAYSTRFGRSPKRDRKIFGD